ncbi:MAG TPA: type II toxin-antitoxin system death-on-curing family toxin [Candidatus Paceibacterota bacterium]|nr:type II toxin-antitoxin system death-on-curing family toxin [Candidatus Paceibacterota bacterium]
MRSKPITIQEVEYGAHALARALMKYSEPIPEFGTRYKGKLESCLDTPFQTYGGKYLYKGLIGKVSILFYLLVKNHAFVNGNKRIAVMTVFSFVNKNKRWLAMPKKLLYEIAKEVAMSEASDKDKEVEKIQKIFNIYLVKAKR